MRLQITKEWLERHRKSDEGHDCSAGDLMLRSRPRISTTSTKSRELSPAFGALVKLWRIDRRMSIDDLARAVKVDRDEVESIETQDTHSPEPQTVCALASIMNIPETRLLQLAGNIVETDVALHEHSIRFAANAKQWDHLSKAQQKALREFIKYLNEH